MRMTILYDNEALRPPLQRGWGFGCLLEHAGQRLLFDTGWDADRLLANAAALGVELTTVTAIFISHEHWDHMGGLPRLLRVIARPRVWLPAAVPSLLRQEISELAEVVPVAGAQPLGERLYSTGELPSPGGEPHEQALIVELGRGCAMITGCAHPGVAPLLAAAGQRGEVRWVIGGFHSHERFADFAPLELVVPCHCTAHKQALQSAFPERVQVGGVGMTLDLV